MSLNLRRGRVPPASPIECPGCGLAVTMETLTRSTRFVVPCFRYPALNKLAGDQYSCLLH